MYIVIHLIAILYMYIGAVNCHDPEDFFRVACVNRRSKRQALNRVYTELNYTDEHRAICGNDPGCLHDYAVTGLKDAAVGVLDHAKNFTKKSAELGMINKKIVFALIYNYSLHACMHRQFSTKYICK